VQRRTLTGAQTGRQRAGLWFAMNGLPLRNERKITVNTETAIGSVTYTEDGSFTLTSRHQRA
jgi:hypothetical protein